MSKQFIKDYFTFSRSERKGIIILSVLIILTLAFRLLLPVLIRKPHEKKAAFDKEVKDWINTFNDGELQKSDTLNFISTKDIELSLFEFDPNIITSDEIKKLGVGNNARKAWINYVARGGRFYRKEDLKKIYGIDSGTYERLRPYITTGKEYNQRISEIDITSKNVLKIELNKATQEQFESLNGIGPVLAGRICKYRKLLGGFTRIYQLNEVFGITDSIVRINENRLFIDTSQIQRININKADFLTLSGHPYISDYEAKAIIHYREMKGFIKFSNELVINYLISDSVFTKLADYLYVKEY